MRVCLGGTFDPFHKGHEALLQEAAREATALFVGITDGVLARRADREIPPWRERAARVEAYLREEAGYWGELEVAPITDAAGPAAMGTYDAIAVSPDTRKGADAINERRARLGLAALHVRVAPLVLAQDLLPVSGTRVHAGDIDRDGVRRTPVRVAVGSANPVKLAAVRNEAARVLGVAVEARAFAVPSGVAEQPQSGDTLRGARERARQALAVWPEADYGVGIEAGLNQDPDATAWYDAQACVVRDRLGVETDGWGPAFQYPPWATKRALAGEMVSSILGPVAADDRIGGTIGAIGFLTDGRMDRTDLTRIALLMAFVPRIRRHLYIVGPPPQDV